MTNQQLVEQALAHHQAGRRAQAETIYRQVLAQEPSNVDALHLLGVLAHEAGRNDIAASLIQRALSINPLSAPMFRNMGRVLEALGKADEAIANYRNASAMQPDDANILNDLGNALRAKNRLDESLVIFNRAVKLDPKLFESHNNLAVVLLDLGRTEQALACVRKALALDLNSVEANYNLGKTMAQLADHQNAVIAYQKTLRLQPNLFQAQCNLGASLYELGQYDQALEIFNAALAAFPNQPDLYYNAGNVLQKLGSYPAAIEHFRMAISLRPNHPESHTNLGNALFEIGKLDEAMASLNQALALRPEHPEAHNNVGNILHEKGDVPGAIARYHRALAAKPNFAYALNNLGNVLNISGQVEEAIACFKKARDLNPKDADVHSNLIYSMHYHAGFDWAAISRELFAWNKQHAVPLRNLIQKPTNDRDSDRRLKIGYVSPDFGQHVVGCNMLPLLGEHDHNQFQIFCYAHVLRPDAITEQLRGRADAWRDILGIGNNQAARMIREDKIDILVDLSLHSARNRLLLFAQKSAPIQLSYLGYCSSTGVETIDYRFSDPHIDPPELHNLYSEKTICLPQTYWCYQPSGPTPAVSVLPASSTGRITFGCLNNFAKVSGASLQLWAKILNSLPGSRLLLHAAPGGHISRVLQHIPQDRIEFIPKQDYEQYMRVYQRIDVALDPFPYGGGITTCDALWMGVPVITLEGQTPVGRGGKSILHNLALQEFVAKTPEEYQQIALNLASDLSRLTILRQTLRDRMKTSPLMDAKSFAKNVEQSYRKIWKEWCKGD